MTRRRRLGQHFLSSESVAQKIIDAARIRPGQTVLEIGTGTGMLTRMLCRRAAYVISIETDRRLYEQACSELCGMSNLDLRYGDGFASDDNFDVFVSSLPYSKSRAAIEWLIQRRYSRAVIMVQKEFAEKISGRSDRSIAVLADYALAVRKIADVGPSCFEPRPKVSSTVLALTPKNVVPSEIVKTVNRIFSYKKKTLKNILEQFDVHETSSSRLGQLRGEQIIEIAQKIVG